MLTRSYPSRTDASRILQGKKILVAEDDLFVGLDIVESLEREGAIVFGPIVARKDALQICKLHDVDFALLDLTIGGGDIMPIAQSLKKQKVPCIFYTGDRKYAMMIGLDRFGPVYEKYMPMPVLIQNCIDHAFPPV